jgi:5-methyltetrahydropteroyltriglutamate--homocysteine methyltransferase
MHRSEDRILTTHTGSLPRPAALVDRYLRHERGEPIDRAETERLGRAAVRSVLRRQIAAGIDIGNDGEQRRDSFNLHMKQRLSGLGGTWQRPPRADVERYPAFKEMRARLAAVTQSASNQSLLPTAVGEIRNIDPDATRRECADLLEALDEAGGRFVECFMTAPSPGILATTIRNEYYDDDHRYIEALGAAMKVEYEAIAAHGLVVQLDCPDLGLERHVYFSGQPLATFLRFVEKVVDTINASLANVPRQQVRMHVCWGNSESPHDCDVPLEDILPIIERANVGALVLPFANPRHAHEFSRLRASPLADDQIIVAGVIDTLTNVIEHPEVIADRIERVAEAVGDPRRVIGGTDCGFDTAAGAGRVAEDVVWAKLAALAEGARLASRRLFGRSRSVGRKLT